MFAHQILFGCDDKKQESCPLARINRHRLLVGDHVLSQSLATLMVMHLNYHANTLVFFFFLYTDNNMWSD